MGVARAGRSEAVHPAGGGVGVAQLRRRRRARRVRRHCGQMLQLHRQMLVRPKREALPYLDINGVHSVGNDLLPVERRADRATGTYSMRILDKFLGYDGSLPDPSPASAWSGR